MTLKLKVNHPHFQYELRVSYDACLVIPAEICDKSICRQGKDYGQMDRRTEGRTDTGNDSSPLTWKAEG